MNEGRIEQLDVPEVLYSSPKNRFVADFIGTINLIAADVVESTRHGLRLSAPGLGEIAAPALMQAKSGTHGTLAIRPEHLRISPHAERAELKNHFAGIIGEYLYLGDVTVYKVRLDNGLLIEALATNAGPGRARFHEIGNRVSVEWRHDAGVFLQN
jgi:spermidine/putrescine transport system ATP-binding protein